MCDKPGITIPVKRICGFVFLMYSLDDTIVCVILASFAKKTLSNHHEWCIRMYCRIVLYWSFGHYCNDKCYLFLQAERDTRLSYRLDERYLRLIIGSGSFSYIGRENLWGDRDVLDAFCARLSRIMILIYYLFFYFSLCFFVFTKRVLSGFCDCHLSTCALSSRKCNEFYCFCCRGSVDDDGNVVVGGGGGSSSGGGSDGGDGGGNCCCCRSCSCWWSILAYHHTRRLGVSQSSSASWTATKNTLYHLNTQTLVKSWSEFQESNRNMLDNIILSLPLFHSSSRSSVCSLPFAPFLSLFHSFYLSLLHHSSLLLSCVTVSHTLLLYKYSNLNLPSPWLNLHHVIAIVRT